MENSTTHSSESLRDLLVATHLYYDIGNKSLRARAFGEIITKIVFFCAEKKAKFNDITAGVAKVVGVPQVTAPDIQSGLDFLKEKGTLEKRGKFWFLKNEENQRIETDLKNAQQRIDHILDKHFGTKMDREKLTAWFKDAAVNVFSQFSEVWAKRLRRESVKLPDPEKIQSIITDLLKTYDLENDKSICLNGFNAFLQDYEDVAVEQQIWSFAQAMLSAKLVTASIGPDPLSIGEFKNCKLLLDTNILCTASLEKSRLAKSFSSLAASIKSIGASFATTEETKDEYERMILRKKEQALRAINSYSMSVIKDARDPFLETALSRGCIDEESFARFFDSIKNFPDKIGSEVIEMLHGREIEKAIQEGRNDIKKQSVINAEWKSQRHFDKPRHALEHDAAMDSVLEALRKDDVKSWIITADGPMQTLSARWAGARPPSWIGIETLIQILAISSGGPSHKPEHFAPLFGTIIRENVHSSDLTYTLEDLDSLLDLEDRVKELENVEIEKFATKMRRLRMSGKSKNDSELQLEIRRTFQRKKMNESEVVRKLERRVAETTESLKQSEVNSETAEKALIAKIYREESLKNIIKWVLKIVLVLLIGAVLVWYGTNLWNNGKPGIGALLVGVGLTEFIIPVFAWIIPGYKKIWAEARALATEKAKKILAKNN